jgi:hypothetical protein
MTFGPDCRLKNLQKNGINGYVGHMKSRMSLNITLGMLPTGFQVKMIGRNLRNSLPIWKSDAFEQKEIVADRRRGKIPFRTLPFGLEFSIAIMDLDRNVH